MTSPGHPYAQTSIAGLVVLAQLGLLAAYLLCKRGD